MMARSDDAGRSVSQALHFVEEGELVGELHVDRRVGHVAAGRHVEIMQRDRILQPGALAERDRDMPAVAFAAIGFDRRRLERQPRDHHDAVVALLAVQREMLVTEPLELFERKTVVRTLGFLQAQNVGLRRLDEFGDQPDAQAYRIDVPGRDGDFHARRAYRDWGIIYW